MSRFAIRNPYFIVVVCLIIAVVSITTRLRMPVDMFPSMNIPVVACATFYSGMPPEQIEIDVTSRCGRFFTLGSGIDHIESRSLPGVSLIKVDFQPGTDADSAVTTISNLAMAQSRRLPQGTRVPPCQPPSDAWRSRRSEAVITSCHVRLRPIVMTALATLTGLLPMALKLGAGSESYTPLARAPVGGLSVSDICTVFVVPAAFLLPYRNHRVTQESLN